MKQELHQAQPPAADVPFARIFGFVTWQDNVAQGVTWAWLLSMTAFLFALASGRTAIALGVMGMCFGMLFVRTRRWAAAAKALGWTRPLHAPLVTELLCVGLCSASILHAFVGTEWRDVNTLIALAGLLTMHVALTVIGRDACRIRRDPVLRRCLAWMERSWLYVVLPLACWLFMRILGDSLGLRVPPWESLSWQVRWSLSVAWAVWFLGLLASPCLPLLMGRRLGDVEAYVFELTGQRLEWSQSGGGRMTAPATIERYTNRAQQEQKRMQKNSYFRRFGAVGWRKKKRRPPTPATDTVDTPPPLAESSE